jgi:hypothetical protein
LTYDSIDVAWADLLGHVIPFDRQPYSQLETVLRKSGADRAADDVYLQRRAKERDQFRTQEPIRFGLDSLYWVVANYGVRPYQLIVAAIILVAVGTVVFTLPGATAAAAPAGSAAPATSTVMALSIDQAFVVSLNQFLPIALPVVSGASPSFNGIQIAGGQLLITYAAIAVVERLLGWILVPLGLLTLSGLLHRSPSS